MTLSKEENLKAGELIPVAVEMAGDRAGDYSYEYFLSTAEINVMKYYVNSFVATEVIGSGPKVRVRAPFKKGIYRLYCFVKDSKGNLSSLNKTISVGSGD